MRTTIYTKKTSWVSKIKTFWHFIWAWGFVSTTPRLFQRKLIFCGWLWFSRTNHCNPTQQQSHVYRVCVWLYEHLRHRAVVNVYRRHTCGQCCSLMCADVTSGRAAGTPCVWIYERGVPRDLKKLRCPTWETKEGVSADSFRKSESSRFDLHPAVWTSTDLVFLYYSGYIWVCLCACL